MLGHTRDSAKVSIVPWSELVSSLADQKNDIMLILSPRNLADDFDRFEARLRAFKERNPASVVVMNNLHSPLSLQTALLETLKSASLVDHIEQGFAFFPVLLQNGAERLEAKV